MNKHINVSYDLYTTRYGILRTLDELYARKTLSFDTEVQSVYNIDERNEAKELLKCCQDERSPEDVRLSKLVANSSGLSHPKITKVTHFQFGLSEDEAVIFICRDMDTELLVWNWLAEWEGKLLVHNAGFDLKIMHERTGKFPKDFEDTQLLAKCLINDADDWKARTGLKHLMGEYYDPKWQELDDDGYDVVDYKNEAFLRYCAIDVGSTYKLYTMLMEEVNE